MWQFPMVEQANLKLNDRLGNEYGLQLRLGEELIKFSHIFSHIIWDLSVHEAVVEDISTEDLENKFNFVEIAELADYPFSVSHLKVMELLKEE